jgi:chaperonin cofactor prefoldin
MSTGEVIRAKMKQIKAVMVEMGARGPRPYCGQCGGHGIYSVSYSDHAFNCNGDCDSVGCPVETFQSQECDCGVQMEEVVKSVKAATTWMKEHGAPDDYVEAVHNVVEDSNMLENSINELEDQLRALKSRNETLEALVLTAKREASRLGDELDKVSTALHLMQSTLS